MQMQATAGYTGGQIPNPYMAYGAPPLTDEAGVYLPTGPGDAQRMELLNMPGDGSDVWLDVRTVQLYLQISLTSIYKLIHHRTGGGEAGQALLVSRARLNTQPRHNQASANTLTPGSIASSAMAENPIVSAL